MVAIEKKFHVKEVVPPLFERLDGDIKFFIIRGILLPNVIKLFTKNR